MTNHCFLPTFVFRWNTFSMILRRNIMIRIIFPFYPSQNHWKGMVDHHFASIFNRSWSPKETTWGTCPTRTGASWASFIAGFGRQCCGTINGVASCWMDFRMSPSEMRLGLQPVDWSGGGECWSYDVHNYCPHRSLNPHEVVGFLPLLDQPRINLSFSRKTHRKAGVCRKTVESLRVFFFETWEAWETCLKVYHGTSDKSIKIVSSQMLASIFLETWSSPVDTPMRSQRPCWTSPWQGWRNFSFPLPTAPQTLQRRKSLGGYQETCRLSDFVFFRSN